MRSAEIGFAAVSGDRAAARHQVEEARRFIDSKLLGRAEVLHVAQEEWDLEA